MNVEGAPSSEAEVFIPRQHLFQLRRALEKHV